MDKSDLHGGGDVKVPSEVIRPTFADLQKHAEAGIIKRGVARYLITKNPERSVRMHRFLGTPLVGKLVMSTGGKSHKEKTGGNYRLDSRKGRLERTTHFALGGSLINEAVHGGDGIFQLGLLALNGADSKALLVLHASLSAFEVSLVALQRYNRARALVVANKALEHGENYSEGYENWLGIDARAMEKFHDSVGSPTFEPPVIVTSTEPDPIAANRYAQEN